MGINQAGISITGIETTTVIAADTTYGPLYLPFSQAYLFVEVTELGVDQTCIIGMRAIHPVTGTENAMDNAAAAIAATGTFIYLIGGTAGGPGVDDTWPAPIPHATKWLFNLFNGTNFGFQAYLMPLQRST